MDGKSIWHDTTRAIHVALRVNDLRVLPGKSETPSYCHLLIRDLQQAQPTADLVLHHIAAVTLALSTIHTLHCSLLLTIRRLMSTIVVVPHR